MTRDPRRSLLPFLAPYLAGAAVDPASGGRSLGGVLLSLRGLGAAGAAFTPDILAYRNAGAVEIHWGASVRGGGRFTESLEAVDPGDGASFDPAALVQTVCSRDGDDALARAAALVRAAARRHGWTAGDCGPVPRPLTAEEARAMHGRTSAAHLEASALLSSRFDPTPPWRPRGHDMAAVAAALAKTAAAAAAGALTPASQTALRIAEVRAVQNLYVVRHGTQSLRALAA